MPTGIQVPIYIVIGWLVPTLQNSKFVWINVTAVTMGHDHGNVTQYISLEPYTLRPKQIQI